MNLPNIEAPKLNLSRSQNQLPLLVDMERFFEFSFWIAEELLDLEAQYRPEFDVVSGIPLEDDLRLSKSSRFTGGL